MNKFSTWMNQKTFKMNYEITTSTTKIIKLSLWDVGFRV